MKNQKTDIRRGSEVLRKPLSIEPTPKDPENRTCIRVWDNEGILVERSYSLSYSELKDMHDAHRCDMWCEHCYQAAMETLTS